MSIATISIAPTPLKEYKNTIIWKTPPVKWNQENTQYHWHIYSELLSLQLVMLKEQRTNKDNAVFFVLLPNWWD